MTGWYTSLAPKESSDIHKGLCILQRDAWSGGKYAAMYKRASPCQYTGLAQMFLEPILRRQAQSMAPESIHFDCGVKSIQPGKPGEPTTVVLDDGRSVKARYVLCADGGRFCADALGIDLVGPR